MVKIIEELHKRNPYPEDIFIPLTKEEIASYVGLLRKNGYSSDRIHAHWMRESWKNCCEELRKMMDDDNG